MKAVADLEAAAETADLEAVKTAAPPAAAQTEKAAAQAAAQTEKAEAAWRRRPEMSLKSTTLTGSVF